MGGDSLGPWGRVPRAPDNGVCSGEALSIHPQSPVSLHSVPGPLLGVK